MGFLLGGEFDVLGFVIRRYFGCRSFGKIYGSLYGIFQLGGAIGTFGAGYVRTSTGTYTIAMWGFAVLCAIIIVIFMTLGPYDKLEQGAACLRSSKQSKAAAREKVGRSGALQTSTSTVSRDHPQKAQPPPNSAAQCERKFLVSEFAARRVIFSDDEVESRQNIIEVRPSERHGLGCSKVKCAVRTHEIEGRLREQCGFIQAG
jgi:MFS family permease